MNIPTLLTTEIERAGHVHGTGRINLRSAARAMGVPYSTLVSWVGGDRVPSAGALDEALRRLGRRLVVVGMEEYTVASVVEDETNVAGSTGD